MPGSTTQLRRPSAARPGGVAAALAPIIERLDARLDSGRPFPIEFWDGSRLEPTATPQAPAIRVRRPRAFAHLLRHPNQLGLVRAYVMGDLDAENDDLEAVLTAGEAYDRLRVERADLVAAVRTAPWMTRYALRPAPAPPQEARLRGRRHSLRRDRAAISHHYDVSNAFYRMVLGPSLVYSCAYFADPSDTLEAAQERKLDRICRKLRLQPGERFLDVGCGWGSLVLHAAQHYGAQAVGITLSEPQAELARQRVREAGLADRCEIRVADYRETSDGPYDKIASVGMVEHVGRAQLAGYAACLRGLLRPGGLLLNHGIVQAGPWPRDHGPFISRYVFPDGELGTLTSTLEALEGAGLEVRDVESLREHYPHTLRRWVANLNEHRDAATAEAGEARVRIWRLYMISSALGFERGGISVHQVLATAPGAPHELPLVREL